MSKKTKIINALLGLAVGDAVGNRFEFETTIDPKSVLEWAHGTQPLIISDDTQMTLYGFEAMAEIGTSTEDGVIELEFENSYLDWYETQTRPDSSSEFKFGLSKYSSMWSIQAPGNTCLQALRNIVRDSRVRNDSMGCGSVMRLLPALLATDPMQVGKISAGITHHHPTNADAVYLYINYANCLLNGIEMQLPLDIIEARDIQDLGLGWTALECVKMAIWSHVNANTFDELLVSSIAHPGDSDSVAAIAGSLWGLGGGLADLSMVSRLDALDAINFIVGNKIIK